MRGNIINPATKYLKAVIPRLDRGIHKELDAPIKSEHDSFVFKVVGVIICGDLL